MLQSWLQAEQSQQLLGWNGHKISCANPNSRVWGTMTAATWLTSNTFSLTPTCNFSVSLLCPLYCGDSQAFLKLLFYCFIPYAIAPWKTKNIFWTRHKAVHLHTATLSRCFFMSNYEAKVRAVQEGNPSLALLRVWIHHSSFYKLLWKHKIIKTTGFLCIFSIDFLISPLLS